MPQDALMAVMTRNRYYKKGQRRMTSVLLISMLVNVLLGYLLLHIINNPPAPRYFATAINGRIIPLFPLDQPNQADDSLLQWASSAAIAAFTYNFVNYREELQASSGFFTPDGWQLFLNALEQSNNLDAVRVKRLIVSATAINPATIVQKSIIDGRYTWRVQIPIQVTYQSPTEYTQQNNLVTLLITRVSTLNTPQGIGIAQFVVAPM